MEGADSLLWLVLLILAILASCVLYLLFTRRHYQRVDYARLVERELERRQLAARLDRLEQLVVELAEQDRRRSAEQMDFMREAIAELAERIKRASVELGGEVLENPQMLRFLRSPRQQKIAELLELGHNSQEVSRLLGVSRHEVELVSAIIFKTKSA